jgi:hypothetical protein
MREWKRGADCFAGAVLRFCVALLLILQIAYTPIHLSLEPHSDEADFSAAAPRGSGAMHVGEEDHDADAHHERHPAAQHKFKLTQPARAPLVEMLPVEATERVAVERDCPRVKLFEFSGLSPPELPCSWQFVLRTALPVRAPSLLS